MQEFTTRSDERPTLWVGHVAMSVADPQRSHDYYVGLGMRSVQPGDEVAITELRGGTHLVLTLGEVEPGDAPFDLMVDDVRATRARYQDAGLDVSEIITGKAHDVFVITDPDGKRIVVFSSHVIGPV